MLMFLFILQLSPSFHAFNMTYVEQTYVVPTVFQSPFDTTPQKSSVMSNLQDDTTERCGIATW